MDGVHALKGMWGYPSRMYLPRATMEVHLWCRKSALLYTRLSRGNRVPIWIRCGRIPYLVHIHLPPPNFKMGGNAIEHPKHCIDRSFIISKVPSPDTITMSNARENRYPSPDSNTTKKAKKLRVSRESGEIFDQPSEAVFLLFEE